MGYLEAFRGNTNGAKHPSNVKSHVGLPRNVIGENMTSPKKTKNVPKTLKIKGFGLSRGPSSKRHGIPPRTIGGHWKGVICGLERIYGCLFVHFDAILGFDEK